MSLFADRVDAGRRLAAALEHLRGPDVVVLGLPRGGVPVAAEVAQALGAPLDVLVVRKLGVPFQPELAMGAVGEGGVRVLDQDVLAATGVTDDELLAVERHERAELDVRVRRFREGRPAADLRHRVAIVVDDGIATGSTARAGCAVARGLGAARVVLAVPVAPAETVRDFTEADEVVCLEQPRPFVAVGMHYRDFAPTGDDEVVGLLEAAVRRVAGGPGARDRTDGELGVEVEIAAGAVALPGHLYLPDRVRGVVLFAHGSGSGRHSPRNRFVALVLQRAGLGTLLVDLLTPDEELDRANVFDIDLLTGRLSAATRWLAARPGGTTWRLGYFGASTGAAAALCVAANEPQMVAAVVSRGGRPDLAGPWLSLVRAPTLLIVGSADKVVLDLNRAAQARLRCLSRLAVVDGATHLFEEPGTLAEAAVLAQDWFVTHLFPLDRDSAAKADL